MKERKVDQLNVALNLNQKILDELRTKKINSNITLSYTQKFVRHKPRWNFHKQLHNNSNKNISGRQLRNEEEEIFFLNEKAY